jgi:uncharacterized CHY-type Zn-finger protein
MKRFLISAVLIIACCTVTFATKKVVAEGKTHSVFGDYKIESIENPVMINGKELKAFTITYANTGLKTTVAIEKTLRSKKYYVLSDMLSVQYVCNGSYFGVERLDKKLEKEGYETTYDALDNFQYYHQKVLSCGTNTDVENTKLIAAYFPFLFKNTEEVLAVK